jgi:hypothetical protein
LWDKFNSNRNLDAHTYDIKKAKSLKAFDWIKAAKIIKENNFQNASIGLDILLEDTIPILHNGKPVKSIGIMFLSSDSNPVLINNDSGEIVNCFFIVNERDLYYNSLQTPTSKETTKVSGWPNTALEIIKEAFYYKNIGENKFSQVYLISPIFYFWKILECGCFGI